MIPKTYRDNIVLCQLARTEMHFVNDIKRLGQWGKVNDFKGLGPLRSCKLRPPRQGVGVRTSRGVPCFAGSLMDFFTRPIFLERSTYK